MSEEPAASIFSVDSEDGSSVFESLLPDNTASRYGIP